LIKVPSLDGSGKMSKSENQYATIYLADDDEIIRKKVMKAKTDAGPKQKLPKYLNLKIFFY
jgi:tryptophanyl-tRNA synthetase